MIELIIVSHGNFAKEILKSAELIAGEQEHVHTFGLHLGDSVDKLRDDLSEAIEKVQNREVLILTDMFSGSPFNATVSLMQHYSFFHITGINLPILLEILMSRETTGAAELCDDLLSRAKDTIIDVNKYFEVSN